MGQRSSKAHFVDAALPFLNLSMDDLSNLWDAFNDVAEGFGLNFAEFDDVCSRMTDALNVKSRQHMSALARDLFTVLDTDGNQLIDALELLGMAAMVSSLEIPDKLAYCFNLYDFDESGRVSIDEVTLALKSTLLGLAKVTTGVTAPPEPDLEDIAIKMFRAVELTRPANGKISREEFIGYASRSPEMKSWILFFDSPWQVEGVDTTVAIEYGSFAVEARARGVKLSGSLDPDVLIFEEAEALPEDFAAVKPWMGALENLTPTNVLPANTAPPDHALEINWVYGFESTTSRNNVSYSTSGDVVYHAAGVGVVYGIRAHQQRFNMDHTDRITCCVTHPTQPVVASGEQGYRPKICLWDSETTKLVACIQGYHRNGVALLSWSPSGTALASVGSDEHHSLAVHKWPSENLSGRPVQVFSARTTTWRVLGCAFVTDECVVTCGAYHVFFWRGSGQLHKKVGLFGRRATQISCTTSVVGSNERAVSGTACGHLCMWDGRNCKNMVKAHEGAIEALCTHQAGLVSGGADGKIRLWNQAMEPGAQFDLSSVGCLRSQITSVCMGADRTRMLVATSAAEIFELNAANGSNVHPGPLVTAHFAKQLLAMDVQPRMSEFATAGEDLTLRVWDLAQRRLRSLITVDSPISSVAFSPDGVMLAVGYGGTESDPDTPKAGCFSVLEADSLHVTFEARDSRAGINLVRFSPDGSTLAVASSDTFIYLYHTEDMSSKGKCKGHTGGVTHLDFSSDSAWIRSCSDTFELMFFDTDTAAENASSNAMKDVIWETTTCIQSWEVQGIWPAEEDGFSTITRVDRTARQDTIAVATSHGRIRLYRWPCLVSTASCNEYRAHAPMVSGVRFTNNDTHLISIGAEDRCAIQWVYHYDQADDDASDFEQKYDSEDAEDLKDGEALDQDPWQRRLGGGDVGFDFEEKELDESEALRADPVAVTSLRGQGWRGNVIAPTIVPPEDGSRPPSNLELEWVHGYNHCFRNNLAYTGAGKIVYASGATGVVLDKNDWRQRFNQQHTDMVASLVMHPDGVHVATGQVGAEPEIVVWNTETCETVRTLRGLHRRAVNQMAFSRDGTLLASAGQDDQHQIAVYDWASGHLVASGMGDASKVMAMTFIADDALVTCGVRHIRFWSISGRNMRFQKGIVGKQGKRQIYMSVAVAFGGIVIGTGDGNLYKFVGRQVQTTVKAHQGPVATLNATAEGLCSGGSRDGLIKLWNREFECTNEFLVTNLGSINPGVRSVVWNVPKQRLLVGTSGCEVYEISSVDGSNRSGAPVVQGHFSGGVFGLATHPTRQQFATVGDDRTLRVWDSDKRALLRVKRFENVARAVCYSPEGDLIAVGMGGDVGHGRGRNDGTWAVLSNSDLHVEHEARDSRQAITDIKFSPDGTILAAASQDGKIYLYDATADYILRSTFQGHTNAVTHFDFSKDSQYIVSCCADMELMFSDAATGQPIQSSSALKNVDWNTWTGTLGWPVQGIWPQYPVDYRALHRSAAGDLIAAGDNYGRLSLFRYPCTVAGAAAAVFRGHAPGIGNVRFSQSDHHVFSTGAGDRAVMQWRHVKSSRPEQAADAGESGEESDLQPEFAVGYELEAAEAEGDDAEQFLAVKPWVGVVVPPTVQPEEDLTPPSATAELVYVSGHRGQDARGNVRYNAGDAIVYSAGCVGVVFDRSENTQIFYQGHRGDIVGLAVSPNGRFVATGDAGARPVVRVWDALSAREVCVLPAMHERAVLHVAFSPDGSRVASVGAGRDHLLCVWRTLDGTWVDGHLEASAKTSTEKSLFAAFTEGADGFHLVTGGVKHVNFWAIAPGRLITEVGVFGRRAKRQPLLCGAASGSSVVTGTASGHLYLWEQATVLRKVLAHAGAVFCLHGTNEGFVSGGKDGIIKTWDPELAPLQDFDIKAAPQPPYLAPIRSVCWNTRERQILVGTKGGEIYEVSTDSGDMLLLQESHCEGGVYGLATHPTDPNLFCTGGDDATVRVWSISERRCVAKLALGNPTRAVAWSPDGLHIVAGLGAPVARRGQKKDGAFVVIDTETMTVVYEGRESRRHITAVKFSGDGSVLGVGSNDSKIYLHEVGGAWPVRGICMKHTSHITAFDFSDDGEQLQSNCGGFELLYFNTDTGSEVPSAAPLKNKVWNTWTCPLGWPVQGIWPVEQDGVEINAVDRAHSSELMAVARGDGAVRLYRYPSAVKGAQAFEMRGHSADVSVARFCSNDAHLVTTGARDRAVFVWRVSS